MEPASGTPLSAACLGSPGPQVSPAVLEDCVLQNNWAGEINWASVASCSLIPGKKEHFLFLSFVGFFGFFFLLPV